MGVHDVRVGDGHQQLEALTCTLTRMRLPPGGRMPAPRSVLPRSWVAARSDDAGLVGVDDGLDAVSKAELGEDARDVALDGGVTEIELRGNLGVDTITHGIAGALIGKAFFSGDDMFPAKPMNRARIISWSLMLGAIFPDIDVLRDIFSHDDLLMITWHRSITHSLLLLAIFSLLLAVLTRWIARKCKWDAPSFAVLALIYAIGIFSHILLDLATTFGTMIWSPLAWSRPAWDLVFIVDFTFTGILLVPQFVAWVYRDAKLARLRALLVWAGLRSTHIFRGCPGADCGRANFPHGCRSDHHDFVAADSAPGHAWMGNSHSRGDLESRRFCHRLLLFGADGDRASQST